MKKRKTLKIENVHVQTGLIISFITSTQNIIAQAKKSAVTKYVDICEPFKHSFATIFLQVKRSCG